jgi:transposase
MQTSQTAGVDLAKNVIQASVVTKNNKEILNKKFTRNQFSVFLAKQKLYLVAFEACATAYYWARYAKIFGHQVKILLAIAVAPYQQGHKTDKNDALAVAEYAVRLNIKEAPMKSASIKSRIYIRDLYLINCIFLLNRRSPYTPRTLIITDGYD